MHVVLNVTMWCLAFRLMAEESQGAKSNNFLSKCYCDINTEIQHVPPNKEMIPMGAS